MNTDFVSSLYENFLANFLLHWIGAKYDTIVISFEKENGCLSTNLILRDFMGTDFMPFATELHVGVKL